MDSPRSGSRKRQRDSVCEREAPPQRKPLSDFSRSVASSILSERRDSAVGLEEQISELENLLKRAIENGENASVLLVGARGSGKSLALRSALRRVRLRCIYVKGALFADDAAALQEISRQLQPQEVVSNIGGRNFAGNSRFVAEALQLGSVEGKPMLLVLDDFEIFARGKQTLLYSLLDAAQSRNAAILVLGMSADLTIMRKLEKRVESRFSQRQIFFPGPTLPSVNQLLEESFTLQHHLGDGSVKEYNDAVLSALKSPRIQTALDRSVMCGRPFRFFRGVINDAAALMSSLTSDEDVNTEIFQKLLYHAIVSQAPDGQVQSVADSSKLQLMLLACMSRLEHRGIQSYGFDDVWTEYQQYVRLNPASLERFSRVAAMEGFQSLATRGIIVNGDRKSITRTGIENLQVKLAVDPEVVVNVLDSDSVRCSTTLHRWVTKWNHGLR